MSRVVRYLAPLFLVGVFAQCRDQAPDVTPAAIVIAPAAGAMVSGTTMTLSAMVSNAGGAAIQGPTVEWRSSDASVASVLPTGIVTAVHTGETRIVASVGLIVSSPLTITVSPGAASQLAIRTQPQGASAGAALTTQPIIEVRDAAGNLVTTSTPTVTATIATGGGALTGSTATAVGGVATFTTLAVSGTVGARSLSFSATSLASATSSGFELRPGAAAKLVIRTEPTGAASGAPLRTQPVVEIRDGADNLVSTPNLTVTASVAGGGSTTGGTAVAVDGVATFTVLAITGIVGVRTLSFSATGLANVVSATFMLGPGQPAALRVRIQPSGAASGQPFTRQPVIDVTDDGGNVVPLPNFHVSATVTVGQGVLTSATTTTVDGVATFSGLTLSGTAGERTLTFSADGLTSTTSAPFTLGVGTPARLLLVVQPSSAAAAVPFSPPPLVAVADNAGNITSRSGATVTAALVSGNGTIFNSSATVSAGYASFSSMAIAGPPGTVVLIFRSENLEPVTSTPITLLEGPAVRMIVRVAPASFVRSGVPMTPQPVIVVVDAAGNVVTTTSFVVRLTSDAASGTITNGTATSVNGVATFSGLTLSGPPGARDYEFAAPGLVSMGGYRITITP